MIAHKTAIIMRQRRIDEGKNTLIKGPQPEQFECLMCKEPMRKKDAKILPICGHAYHFDCIDPYFRRELQKNLKSADGLRCPVCMELAMPTVTSTIVERKRKVLNDPANFNVHRPMTVSPRNRLEHNLKRVIEVNQGTEKHATAVDYYTGVTDVLLDQEHEEDEIDANKNYKTSSASPRKKLQQYLMQQRSSPSSTFHGGSPNAKNKASPYSQTSPGGFYNNSSQQGKESHALKHGLKMLMEERVKSMIEEGDEDLTHGDNPLRDPLDEGNLLYARAKLELRRKNEVNGIKNVNDASEEEEAAFMKSAFADLPNLAAKIPELTKTDAAADAKAGGKDSKKGKGKGNKKGKGKGDKSQAAADDAAKTAAGDQKASGTEEAAGDKDKANEGGTKKKPEKTINEDMTLKPTDDVIGFRHEDPEAVAAAEKREGFGNRRSSSSMSDVDAAEKQRQEEEAKKRQKTVVGLPVGMDLAKATEKIKLKELDEGFKSKLQDKMSGFHKKDYPLSFLKTSNQVKGASPGLDKAKFLESGSPWPSPKDSPEDILARGRRMPDGTYVPDGLDQPETTEEENANQDPNATDQATRKRKIPAGNLSELNTRQKSYMDSLSKVTKDVKVPNLRAPLKLEREVKEDDEEAYLASPARKARFDFNLGVLMTDSGIPPGSPKASSQYVATAPDRGAHAIQSPTSATSISQQQGSPISGTTQPTTPGHVQQQGVSSRQSARHVDSGHPNVHTDLKGMANMRIGARLGEYGKSPRNVVKTRADPDGQAVMPMDAGPIYQDLGYYDRLGNFVGPGVTSAQQRGSVHGMHGLVDAATTEHVHDPAASPKAKNVINKIISQASMGSQVGGSRPLGAEGAVMPGIREGSPLARPKVVKPADRMTLQGMKAPTRRAGALSKMKQFVDKEEEFITNMPRKK